MAVIAVDGGGSAPPAGAKLGEPPLEWVSYFEDASELSFFWDTGNKDSFFLSDASTER